MKLNLESVNELSTLLTICRAVGIESAVLSEGQFRGINPGKSVCILTKTELQLENNATLGVGRINELSKRLDLFSGNVAIDATTNNRGEISQMMIGSGKSKTNFRCTSEKVIRYPKSNEDEAVATITLTKDEVTAIARAADALGAVHVAVHCNKNKQIKVECVEDSTNDLFSIEIEGEVDFFDEAQTFVLNFLAKDFKNITALAVKSNDSVSLVLGAVSATVMVNAHTLVLLSQLTGEEDDE